MPPCKLPSGPQPYEYILRSRSNCPRLALLLVLPSRVTAYWKSNVPRDGRLPVVLSTDIDAGYGTGVRCVLCDQRIAPDKIEYGVIDRARSNRLHFHIACHLVWRGECARRMRDFRSR